MEERGLKRNYLQSIIIQRMSLSNCLRQSEEGKVKVTRLNRRKFRLKHMRDFSHSEIYQIYQRITECSKVIQYNCPPRCWGMRESRAGQIPQGKRTPGKITWPILVQSCRQYRPFSTDPSWLRKNFLTRPDLALKSSKMYAGKSISPTSSSPQSEPMESSEAYFAFVTQLQKCL